MTRLKVAVLMGGTSAEREVSLSTGRQILGALDAEKYTVPLDAASGQKFPCRCSAASAAPCGGPHGHDRFRKRRTRSRMCLALHGRGGEDGTLQGLLDLLGIRYTGSGVLASALAMDKAMAKRVLKTVGIRVPEDITLRRGEAMQTEALPLPVIVKPNAQGSTIGMTIVREASEMEAALEAAFEYDDTVLVEQFVTGTEITVPILGNSHLEVLPIVEIVPSGGFYDYKAKYTAGATDEIVPARISDDIAAEARRIAELCHQTLGCRGMSRTDMIVTAQSEIYTLEVNTIPGMTPTSLLPRSADAAGYSFSQLLDTLIGLAREEQG